MKTGISKPTALCLHPTAAQELIRAKACEVIESCRTLKPLPWKDNYTLEIEFKWTLVATVISWMPGIEVVDGRTIRYLADDMRKIMQVLQVMLLLSNQVTKVLRIKSE